MRVFFQRVLFTGSSEGKYRQHHRMCLYALRGLSSGYHEFDNPMSIRIYLNQQGSSVFLDSSLTVNSAIYASRRSLTSCRKGTEYEPPPHT